MRSGSGRVVRKEGKGETVEWGVRGGGREV